MGLVARRAPQSCNILGKAGPQDSPPAPCWAIRRQLASYAWLRHRDDLAPLIAHPSAEREQRARAVRDAIEKLQELPLPAPMVTGAVDRWPPRLST